MQIYWVPKHPKVFLGNKSNTQSFWEIINHCRDAEDEDDGDGEEEGGVGGGDGRDNLAVTRSGYYGPLLIIVMMMMIMTMI